MFVNHSSGDRLAGLTYADVVQIYSISRAGYIPQLFSIRLPNPVVVFELLHRAEAHALIVDPAFLSAVDGCPVPVHQSITVVNSVLLQYPSLPPLAPAGDDETAFIFHTSGSTSGSPKLVPCSYTWLDATVEKSCQANERQRTNGQDVTVWM